MNIFHGIALLAMFAPLSPVLANPAGNATAAPTQRDPVAAANALLDDMQQGHYDAVYARFDDNMKAHVSAAQLRAVWESIPAQMGDFRQRGPAIVDHPSGATGVAIPLVFASGGRLAAHIYTNAAGLDHEADHLSGSVREIGRASCRERV